MIGRTSSAWPILLLTLVVAPPLAAQQPDPRDADPHGLDLPVVEHVLENGMRFLILPREGAPTVTFVLRYPVGSVHESLGYTGIAHMLEHMLFKGTRTVGTRDPDAELAYFPRIDAVADSILLERGRAGGTDSARLTLLEERLTELEDSARAFVVPNEFDRILTRHGARGLNAMTSVEATTYYVQLPANRARLWFILEAERMSEPVFREFYTERDVVAEERRMRVETSGDGLLYEALMATAYRVHPYGVPVVGHMADIQSYTRRQVEEYHRRFYGPNNAVVAVVGAVDPDSVIAWADAYFGPLPRGEDPPPVLAREPEQRGERRVEVRFEAEPRVMMGWHIVDEMHPDMPALVMLASILAGGQTSRLHRRMVLDEKVAQGVSAGPLPGGRFPQLFVIGASPAPSHTIDDLERIVEQELDRLKEAPPDPEELRRIHNQLEAGEVRRLQSGYGLAFQLAESAARYGDWRATFRLSERLRAVRPEDVSRVARTYFRRDNRTVAVLLRPDTEVLP